MFHVKHLWPEIPFVDFGWELKGRGSGPKAGGGFSISGVGRDAKRGTAKRSRFVPVLFTVCSWCSRFVHGLFCYPLSIIWDLASINKRLSFSRLSGDMSLGLMDKLLTVTLAPSPTRAALSA